ncbi:phage tail assembly chaperone [Phytobacter sp. RSE-02]|uniref:phage tail assembly chaperone n=1 Tax=Phytobacter sp. RSE-02 TaxID=3229229 RepID=UPI00339D61CB
MEFTINSVDYRATKLSVFDQLKVCRKLLPVLSSIVPDLSALHKAAAVAGESEKTGQSISTILPKIADVVAGMPEEDVNAILFPCLSVVTRKAITGNWTPVFSNGELMFKDIDLLTMLNIAGRVAADNLGNFLPVPPMSETAVQQPA